jgi:hypothetical protein
MTIPAVTRAPIVLTGLQETTCFSSMQEFIQALPTLIAAAIPSNITNVIVSPVQPTDSQTQDVWFRLSNSGSFTSINVFSQGAWRTIYPVNVDTPSDTLQIFWFQGDPALPPAGWTNTTLASGMDPAIATALAALWVAGTGTTKYYSAIFTGF